jgi:glycosyltransferase involved in cell wall biosynthesis
LVISSRLFRQDLKMDNIKRNKTILCIAIEFFPFNSTGSFRYLKFLNQLWANSYNVIVLVPTFADRKKLLPNAIIDEHLFEEVSKFCTIVELPYKFKDQNKYLKKGISIFQFVGLNLEGWKKEIEKFVTRYLQSNVIDYIYSTIPPFEVGVMSAEVANKFKIKFIVDVRDEWSLNKSNPFTTYLQYRNILKLERKIFILANKIIVVTPELIEIFKTVHKVIPPQKFVLITNGFDFENQDFESNLSLNLAENVLNIAYSGSFYYDPICVDLTKPFYNRKGLKFIGYRQSFTNEDWSYRSPLYFFKAVQLAINKRPQLKNKLFFHYIGNEPVWLRNMISNHDLESNFISHGFVKKSQNLKILASCDSLLLTNEKVIGARSYCISSKLFDYISLNKIILAFVPEGDTKDILIEGNNSILFDPDEIEVNANKIIELFDKVTILNVNTKSFDKYKSENLAKKLIDILND